ncbi:transposase [Pseudomonas sp. MAP12]|uniref:Transposase n=1 Tax=Geopseudomonas aromaticivorans TaxID=2849492 RepID=A0ABS6N0D9_9GAMM|nr:transposase [Pseudomonas aromaticivorans]MBV2133997.1 transposase [Pseudomonas aromaticivorans]
MREIKQRRSYSKALKAQVVQECSLPGNSVASVALSHGINTNVVHRWRRLAACRPTAEALPAFLPVTLESPIQPVASNQAEIRIEIPHRRTTVTLHWPAADAEGCARFVRELLQ